MYDIELQQNVYMAVMELTSEGKKAYTADVAKLVLQRTGGGRLEPLEQRIRYMLKKLTRVGVLNELEGDHTRTRVKKLHYQQNSYYILMFSFNKKVENQQQQQEKQEDSFFGAVFLKQFLGLLGGPMGALNFVSKNIMKKEDKIAEAIEYRKNILQKEGKLKGEDVLSFSFSENQGKLIVMELGITDSGEGLGTYVISRFTLPEFNQLILELVQTKMKEQDGNSNNTLGIEGTTDK